MGRRNCIEESALSAYLDGELNEDAAQGVEAHLAACRDCSASYESMKSDRSLLLEALPDSPAPAHMKVQLFRRIDAGSEARQASGIWAWAGTGQFLHGRSRRWAFACASFAFFALIVSGFHIEHRIEDGRVLAQIDRFKADWVARDKAANPFDIDVNGAPLRPAAKNPFKAYLNER